MVSDLMMGPGPTGEELLLEVRRRSPRSVRLLISGTVTEGTATRIGDTGVAHDFIGKPWHAVRRGDRGDASLGRPTGAGSWASLGAPPGIPFAEEPEVTLVVCQQSTTACPLVLSVSPYRSGKRYVSIRTARVQELTERAG